VVAQELWLQARRSEEITATIRTTVLRLAEDAKGAAGEVRKLRCADPQEVSALQTQVQGALDQVDRTNRDMTDTLAAAADRSEELAREIAGAVTALQFQDRVSQQIGHVIQALESMEMAVVEPMRKGGDAISRVGAGDMRSAYTMEEERAVHAAALGQESAVETSGGDVELF
jgi:methyl-accepting chemotaxis protein